MRAHSSASRRCWFQVTQTQHAKTRLGGDWTMAKCPACDEDVRAPYFFNLEGWSHLACTHCKARLEMKPCPVAALFLTIVLAWSWLGAMCHTFDFSRRRRLCAAK